MDLPRERKSLARPRSKSDLLAVRTALAWPNTLLPACPCAEPVLLHLRDLKYSYQGKVSPVAMHEVWKLCREIWATRVLLKPLLETPSRSLSNVIPRRGGTH